MKDGATAEALVAHFEKNFTADGVEGTPTFFFINGVKHSNMGYEAEGPDRGGTGK